ncbi:MAG: hypothetical protein A2V70_11605 [Planctomycetes bacterium RBG_13_63_9]|nr:MAG: hypothetical protein A2V70_11605 [Planctomycetes bacterium RBG_13_63_9]
MSASLPSAVVFNCHYNGLAIIQELGRRGVPVHALDSERSVGTYSRFARYSFCPNPLTDEAGFIAALQDLGRAIGHRAVLLPTRDEWAVAIARWKDSLSEHFIPCVAEREVVELLIDKRRFAEWAERGRYPVPRSWTADRLGEIPKEAFPIAAKPICYRTSSNDPTKRQVNEQFYHLRLTVLRTPGELARFASDYAHMLEQFLFQQYVEGLSDCMYTIGVYVGRSHEVLGMFTGRKVRGFPPDCGDCFVGESCNVPVALKELVRKACAELCYEGIAEFEFKRDAVTHEFKLIEINPRSWSWIGITPACGVSLPWIAYADLTGVESIEYTENANREGSVKWARVMADLQHCLCTNRRAGFPRWHMSLWQWWKSLRAERLVQAEWAADDPLPALVAVLRQLGAVVRSCGRRMWKAFRRPQEPDRRATHTSAPWSEKRCR